MKYIYIYIYVGELRFLYKEKYKVFAFVFSVIYVPSTFTVDRNKNQSFLALTDIMLHMSAILMNFCEDTCHAPF